MSNNLVSLLINEDAEPRRKAHAVVVKASAKSDGRVIPKVAAKAAPKVSGRSIIKSDEKIATQAKILKVTSRELEGHFRKSLDMVEIIRTGIPGLAVKELMREAALTSKELSEAIGIPDRTLSRRLNETRLSAGESERVVRVATMLDRARDVFGSSRVGKEWLHRENRSLGGATPWSLLDTDIGGREVLAVLGRLEHGVFG